MLEVWNTFVIKQTKIYKQDIDKRKNYVSALYKIKNDLGINNKSSLSALNLFAEELVGDDFVPCEEIKWFEYRYSIFIDALYIFAFRDVKKGKRILKYLKSKINKRYHNKLTDLFDVLFNGKKESFDYIAPQITNWKNNVQFANSQIVRVAIVANMSAGKSTLVNAIVGKEVNKSQNMSCTSKIHYIFNKPYDDGFITEDDDEIIFNAGFDALMNDNENNSTTDIKVGVPYMQGSRVCLIDTPGVNSSYDTELEMVSKNFVKKGKFDILIYVISALNIASDDDEKYLKYICQNVDHSKILFVLNKIDQFRAKDSVEESYNNLVQYLKNIGFKNQTVFPLSSNTAFLQKQMLAGILDDEDDVDALELYAKRLSKSSFSLSKYNELDDKKYDKVIKNTGLSNLEYRIIKESK